MNINCSILYKKEAEINYKWYDQLWSSWSIKSKKDRTMIVYINIVHVINPKQSTMKEKSFIDKSIQGYLKYESSMSKFS